MEGFVDEYWVGFKRYSAINAVYMSRRLRQVCYLLFISIFLFIAVIIGYAFNTCVNEKELPCEYGSNWGVNN